MPNLKLLIITAAVFLVLSCPVGQAREQQLLYSTAPELTVSFGFSAKDRFPLHSLELAVVSPDGRTTWHYAVAGMKETDALMKQRLVPAVDWYSSPGKYSLKVTYQFEGAEEKARNDEQEFQVTGQELMITADLWFMDDQESHQLLLAHLRIKRLLAGGNKVWLIADWVPAKDEAPRYQIVNQSENEISGVGWMGNFFGRIQREVNGQWIVYQRGGFCGTVAGGRPLPPNESSDSIEGYFIGGSKPFASGHYRYVVQYSLRPVREGVPTELIKKALTLKRVQDIYEVTAEFYIEADDR